MLHYLVGQHDVTSMEKSPISCGANGGTCGEDMQILECSELFIDISNHFTGIGINSQGRCYCDISSNGTDR
jgi:hypothetical protein